MFFVVIFVALLLRLCPEPVPPSDPTKDPATSSAYDKQVTAYQEALDLYRDRLALYTQWVDDDARVASILVASMHSPFAFEIVGLSTAFEMWSHFRRCYEPSGDVLYLSMVRQEQTLQQGDLTVDAFYAQMSAVWRQLDTLCTAGCRTCDCCRAL